MGKVTDKNRAEVYNTMIKKRESEIVELQNKISECREYDKACKRKQQILKSTSMLLDDILYDGIISDANLRMLVKCVTVHQNEEKSLDVQFEMNGDCTNSTMIILDPVPEAAI